MVLQMEFISSLGIESEKQICWSFYWHGFSVILVVEDVVTEEVVEGILEIFYK